MTEQAWLDSPSAVFTAIFLTYLPQKAYKPCTHACTMDITRNTFVTRTLKWWSEHEELKRGGEKEREEKGEKKGRRKKKEEKKKCITGDRTQDLLHGRLEL